MHSTKKEVDRAHLCVSRMLKMNSLVKKIIFFVSHKG